LNTSPSHRSNNGLFRLLAGIALLAWLAALGFWIYTESAIPMLVIGSLVVCVAVYRLARRKTPDAQDGRIIEAQRLRATREQARAIFAMANTLSATLDHRRVLEEAQAIGMLNLRAGLGADARLISAALLFQGENNQLRVVSARGLTRADSLVAVPGRRGVLGLALQQGEPVFAGDAGRDPELHYFVAFQNATSVLAIPLKAGYDVYGVMVFGCDQPNAFTDEHVELMTAIGTQSALSLQNAVLYQKLLNEKEKIVAVEEDARKKLARDLHDGPTQSVAAIAMRVNYIRRLIERQPQQANEELWKVEELARRTTKEIRHMLFTLRPLVLETQGLVAALEQMVEKMHDTHNLNVGLKAQPDVAKYLDTNAQGILFYVIEEAVNNARKHAKAEQHWIRLYRREAYVVVEIEDNGVGFDVEAIDASYDQRGSLGMINMRERTELIEGTLRIQSAKGRGTKITVLIPAHAAGEAEAEEGEPAPLLELRSQRMGVQRAAAAAPSQSPSVAEPVPVSDSRPSRPKPLRLPSSPPPQVAPPGNDAAESRPPVTPPQE
jgi:signal transduction histidine kinase